MYPYTKDDVVACFQAAPNLNAALKGFLKNEIQKGDPASKFIKAFKTTIQSKSEESLPNFLDKALPKYEPHLYLILRHAFGDVFDELIEHIFETYAEDFNATYSSTEQTIDITNREEFERLAKTALGDIKEKLASSELPSNSFSQNAVAYSLFEPLVLNELEGVFAQ